MKIAMQFSKGSKWIFSLVLLTSWLSGITFFIFNKWIRIEGDFGPERHPWQFPSLQIHGAAAFLIIMIYGIILGAHVQRAWRTKRLRKSGLLITISGGIMMITAWLLYYMQNEEIREYISYIHAGIGLLLPAFIATHLILAKRLYK